MAQHIYALRLPTSAGITTRFPVLRADYTETESPAQIGGSEPTPYWTGAER
jgi:hypothetical protein